MNSNNINTMILINLYLNRSNPTEILNIIEEKNVNLDKEFILFLLKQKEEIEIHNKLKEIFQDFELIDKDLYNKIQNI